MKVKNYFFSILFVIPPFFSIAQLCFNLDSAYSCNIPNCIITPDLNKDGFKDIAITGSNFHGGTMLGNGTGSFTGCSAFYTAGWSPSGITCGDFNNDTNPDLAVATDVFIEIFLNTGSGIFSTATSTIAFTPYRILSADFNSDLNLDLIVGYYGTDSLAVFLGNGTGTFSAFTTFTLTSPNTDLEIGDFNNDGDIDIATCNSTANSVSILLGTGTGSFGTCNSFSTTPGIRGITVNDFNNDGDKDIVGVNGSAVFYVLLGNGIGNLSSPITFTSIGSTGDIVSEDFNSDGNNDIAISNYFGNVKVFLGNGTGNFSGANSFTLSSGNPWAIAAEDFNGDSKIDLAAGCDNTGLSLAIFLNCTSTGIKELNTESKIQLFPNPASSTLYISSEETDFKYSEIEIRNALGQIVLKTKFKNELDISDLPNGIYILQLKNSQGQVAVKRLVVSK